MLSMTAQGFDLGVFFRMFRFVWFSGAHGPKLKNTKVNPVCIEAKNQKALRKIPSVSFCVVLARPGTKLKNMGVNLV